MRGIWDCMLEETPSVMKTEPMFLLTGDNIAVVTVAPCTCYPTVHSVKKLSLHTGAIRVTELYC